MRKGRRGGPDGNRSRFGNKVSGALSPNSPSIPSSSQMATSGVSPALQHTNPSKRGKGSKKGKGKQQIRLDSGGASCQRQPKGGKNKRIVVEANSSTHRVNFGGDDHGDLHEQLANYSAQDGNRERRSGRGGYVPYNSAYNIYYAPRATVRSGSQRFSSDQYVTANFRFIVKANSTSLPQNRHLRSSLPTLDSEAFPGIRKRQAADEPRVIWEDIVQVICPTSSPPACPFCLSQPPVAPRITKCGHVYCLSCIQRFFHIYEPTKTIPTVPGQITQRTSFRECPICHQTVYLQDFKAVRFWEVVNYRDLEHITFTLMKRPRVDTAQDAVAMPVVGYDPSRILDTDDECAVKYANVIAEAEGYQMEQIWTPDFAALLQEEGMDAEEELILEMARGHVQNAMDELSKATIRKIEDGGDDDDDDNGVFKLDESEILANSPVPDPVQGIEASHGHLNRLSLGSGKSPPSLSLTSLQSSSQDPHRLNAEQAERLEWKSFGPAVAVPEYVYFYQAKDGQPIFLDQLNVKMLGKFFGPFQNWPNEVTATVEAKTPTVITNGLLKQYTYLKHLPFGLEVVFAEMDLSEVIDQATMTMFRESVDERRQQREEQSRIEDEAFQEAQKDRFGLGIPLPKFHKGDDDASDDSSLAESLSEAFPPPPVWPVHLASSPPIQPSLNSDSDFPSMLAAPPVLQSVPKWGAGTATFAQVINRPKQDSVPPVSLENQETKHSM